MASEQDIALAQYLIKQGTVTKADIDEAMADLEKRGSGRLSDFLLMSRKIDAQQLIAAQRALKPGAAPSGRQPAAAPEAAAPAAPAAPANPAPAGGKKLRGLTMFSFNKKKDGEKAAPAPAKPAAAPDPQAPAPAPAPQAAAPAPKPAAAPAGGDDSADVSGWRPGGSEPEATDLFADMELNPSQMIGGALELLKLLSETVAEDDSLPEITRKDLIGMTADAKNALLDIQNLVG